MKSHFVSIRHPFSIDPTLGRVGEESDYAAHVEQLIRQVLLTTPGERINRPDFGCGLRQMLFAPNSQVSASLAEVTVFEALNRWLPNAIGVDDVKVRAVEEALHVTVAYTLKVRQERRYLNIRVTP